MNNFLKRVFGKERSSKEIICDGSDVRKIFLAKGQKYGNAIYSWFESSRIFRVAKIPARLVPSNSIVVGSGMEDDSV